jgi:hypothetical protein
MRWLPLLLALYALSACMSEDVDYFPRTDTGTVSDTGADVDPDAADTSDGSGNPVDEQWAGNACEVNADCGPNPRQCVTRETLDGFGVNEDIQVPGGMCSRLFCSRDEDCGPNGTCFDASFLGAPVQLCLAQCNDIADCRWEEGWDCMPFSVVAEGSADVPEGGACVSDSIQVAIVCDDGHCEEEAQ